MSRPASAMEQSPTMKHPLLQLLALAATTTPGLAQDDWPEFRGPNRDGTAPAVESDFDWGEGGPEVLWRVDIGPGYGGAAIQRGEVFLLDREAGTADVLRVFDLESGGELATTSYEAKGRLSFRGSRSVPTVRGQHVVTAGGFGHVSGFDRVSSELLWSVDFQEVYQGELPMFGFSASPLVVGDVVIVPAFGEEVGLVGLELTTGEELWTTEGIGTSHSSAVLVELHGEPQVVFLSTTYGASGQDEAAPTTVSSFDPMTGELLWRTSPVLTRIPIPGPVQVAEDQLLLTGGYRGGTTLMRIGKTGGTYEFDELWHIERGAQVHHPLVRDGHAYMLPNENWNYDRRLRKEGGLACITLEGKELWRTGDDPFFGRGAAILAGEHLLIQDGFDGTLRVVRATPERYELVAEAELFESKQRDGEMWAPMALSKGMLVMRSQDELICVKL